MSGLTCNEPRTKTQRGWTKVACGMVLGAAIVMAAFVAGEHYSSLSRAHDDSAGAIAPPEDPEGAENSAAESSTEQGTGALGS